MDDRPIKSIIPGGLSMPHLLPDALDVGIDFESIVGAGSMLGSGGIIVICEGESIMPIARRTVWLLSSKNLAANARPAARAAPGWRKSSSASKRAKALWMTCARWSA